MKKTFIFLLLFFIQFVNSQELALVKKKGKFGFITKEGTFAIEPKFEGAKNFSDGLAAIEENGKWGFIDTTGAIVIAPSFALLKSLVPEPSFWCRSPIAPFPVQNSRLPFY